MIGSQEILNPNFTKKFRRCPRCDKKYILRHSWCIGCEFKVDFSRIENITTSRSYYFPTNKYWIFVKYFEPGSKYSGTTIMSHAKKFTQVYSSLSNVYINIPTSSIHKILHNIFISPKATDTDIDMYLLLA